MLQGLLDRQGLREQLHQPEEDLPQAAGVRVRCAVNQFVQLAASGANTIVRIDANGAVRGVVFTDVFVLSGISAAGLSVDHMIGGGNLSLT
jgi:hypothetical protein